MKHLKRFSFGANNFSKPQISPCLMNLKNWFYLGASTPSQILWDLLSWDGETGNGVANHGTAHIPEPKGNKKFPFFVQLLVSVCYYLAKKLLWTFACYPDLSGGLFNASLFFPPFSSEVLTLKEVFSEVVGNKILFSLELLPNPVPI